MMTILSTYPRLAPLVLTVAGCVGSTPPASRIETPNVARPPQSNVLCPNASSHSCITKAVPGRDHIAVVYANKTLGILAVNQTGRRIQDVAGVRDIATNGTDLFVAHALSTGGVRVSQIVLSSGAIVHSWDMGDVVQISAGNNHVLALTSEGITYSWGDNTAGQLGNGQTGGASASPQRVETDRRFNYILATGNTSYGIALQYGQTALYAWGVYYTSTGQTCNPALTENIPSLLSPWIPTNLGAIQCHEGSCLTIADQHVYAFGCNAQGQLGTGNTLPASLSPLSFAASEVAVGDGFSMVIDLTGNAYSSGLLSSTFQFSRLATGCAAVFANKFGVTTISPLGNQITEYSTTHPPFIFSIN